MCARPCHHYPYHDTAGSGELPRALGLACPVRAGDDQQHAKLEVDAGSGPRPGAAAQHAMAHRGEQGEDEEVVGMGAQKGRRCMQLRAVHDAEEGCMCRGAAGDAHYAWRSNRGTGHSCLALCMYIPLARMAY